MKLFISKIHYKKDLNINEKIVYYLLKCPSLFYGAVSNIRNFLYDTKILPSYRSKSYVISVGNLTTGGVGKTPFTIEVAKFFLSKNKKVAIISRGYGAKLSNNEPNLISDGTNIQFKASIAGDEPVMMAKNCPGAIIVTCKSRIKAEKYLAQNYKPDIIILDDAFQHRKIKRDLDILLVDAKNKFGNANVLPAGPLREELKSVKRADKIVVVNKEYNAEKSLKFCDYLKKTFNKAVYLCKMVPEKIYDINTNQELPLGSRIMAFSAIGQPSGFYDFLKQDYKLIAVLEFDDHHIYDKQDVAKIIEYAQKENIEHIVTTEKDAVKLIEVTEDIEFPVKFYTLKLKSYMDIKDILGE